MDQYHCSGWTRVAGRWLYGQKDTEVSRFSIKFITDFQIACDPAMTPLSAMHSAMGMLELSDNPATIVPLVLFAHLGVLIKLFEHAGFPPHLLMFVNGKTGSFKTAACAVKFNLSGDPRNNIPATFRDSIASVEAKFQTYVDQTMLLDDFSPATTAGNRANMNRLLEAIIRYYGKGRGNATVTKSTALVPRGLWHVWLDRVFALVTKRAQLQQRMFPLSITKIHAALAEAKLIEAKAEKRSGRLQMNYLHRETFGERPRMLVINKEAAQQYLDT